MKNEYGLPKEVITKIRGLFAKSIHIKRVLLYGSRALGSYRVGSDIDLCIEGNSIGLTELFAIENELEELLLPWKIDLSLKHQIDNPNLLKHIETKGVVFYP